MKKIYQSPVTAVCKPLGGEMMISLKPQSFDHGDSKPRDEDYLDEDEEEEIMIRMQEDARDYVDSLW